MKVRHWVVGRLLVVIESETFEFSSLKQKQFEIVAIAETACSCFVATNS